MEPDQIIERLGTDNPPTLEELAAAQERLTEAEATLKAAIRAHSGTPYSELKELSDDRKKVAAALESVSEAYTIAQDEIDAIKAEVGEDTETPVEDDDSEDEDEDQEEAKAEPVAASIRQTLARIKPVTPRVEVNEPDLTSVSTRYTVLGRERE